MRVFGVSLVAALCITYASVASAQNSPAVLTNKDVVEMFRTGLGQEIIVAKIKSSDCGFDTSPSVLKELKVANLPDAVILAMVQAPSKHPVVADRILRTAYVTCPNAKEVPEIPMYAAPGDSSAVATPRCGTQVSVLDEGEWEHIKTQDGTIGYMASFFVSKPGESQAKPAEKVVNVSRASPDNNLRPSMLRAIAWRGIPWATTSYYQQQGSAYTNCTGSGTWYGNNWQGNSSCTTQYTPAQSVPVNWQHYTIYNLVETSDSRMVLTCTRNWAFSKCSYLVPGNLFAYENKNGKISIKGHRAGKDKEQSLDLDIVSSEPKN